jgi:hypothetical protein
MRGPRTPAAADQQLRNRGRSGHAGLPGRARGMSGKRSFSDVSSRWQIRPDQERISLRLHSP